MKPVCPESPHMWESEFIHVSPAFTLRSLLRFRRRSQDLLTFSCALHAPLSDFFFSPSLSRLIGWLAVVSASSGWESIAMSGGGSCWMEQMVQRLKSNCCWRWACAQDELLREDEEMSEGGAEPGKWVQKIRRLSPAKAGMDTPSWPANICFSSPLCDVRWHYIHALVYLCQRSCKPGHMTSLGRPGPSCSMLTSELMLWTNLRPTDCRQMETHTILSVQQLLTDVAVQM